MSTIRIIASHILLVSAYVFTWLVAVVGHAIPRRRWKPNGRIAVTGTIFNPNWYLSHITPLTRSGVREVILVIDEPLQPMDGVRFVCPPRWLARLISRAAAKALWLFYVGIRYRPDLFMGYNLVAGGCTALVVGATVGRPACYQMTGGQLVLSTVGVDTNAPTPTPTWRESLRKAIARMAERVIRHFELIVVRGSKGKTFLADYGITDNVEVITGSVKGVRDAAQAIRTIDVVFVGRLNPIKQVDQFIEIIHRVSQTPLEVKAAIVGDGPLMKDLKADVERRNLSGNVEFLGKREDVEAILGRSRVFVLTSKSEGSSIAMAEAMSVGAVPAVADVGELADLVQNGVNGYVIEPNAVDRYVAVIQSLLNDPEHWARLSDNAAQTARQCCQLDVISDRWRRCLGATIEHASASHAMALASE
jgi:glycosyltransferase involved in cell wall biosynthesis